MSGACHLFVISLKSSLWRLWALGSVLHHLKKTTSSLPFFGWSYHILPMLQKCWVLSPSLSFSSPILQHLSLEQHSCEVSPFSPHPLVPRHMNHVEMINTFEEPTKSLYGQERCILGFPQQISSIQITKWFIKNINTFLSVMESSSRFNAWINTPFLKR